MKVRFRSLSEVLPPDDPRLPYIELFNDPKKLAAARAELRRRGAAARERRAAERRAEDDRRAEHMARAIADALVARAKSPSEVAGRAAPPETDCAPAAAKPTPAPQAAEDRDPQVEAVLDRVNTALRRLHAGRHVAIDVAHNLKLALKQANPAFDGLDPQGVVDELEQAQPWRNGARLKGGSRRRSPVHVAAALSIAAGALGFTNLAQAKRAFNRVARRVREGTLRDRLRGRVRD